MTLPRFYWQLSCSDFSRKLYLVMCVLNIHCVTKSDTDVAHYNFNAHQTFSVIFGRDVAERACYQMVIFIPPLLTTVSALPGKTWTPKILSVQSCCIPCVDNDTAFGTCCRLRLLLGRKSIHCSIASQLAERSRLCTEQWEEVRHRS